jgi:hypothetical protein
VETLLLMIVIGGLVFFLLSRLRKRGLPGGDFAQGTLLVTGVSSGADSGGSQFVTLTGVITGPTVSDHEVYTRVEMQAGTAPSIGQLMPIVYSPKNPDTWAFAPTQVPGPTEPYGPTGAPGPTQPPGPAA